MDRVENFSLESLRNHFPILSKPCPPKGVRRGTSDLGSFQDLAGSSVSILGYFHSFQ